MSSVTGTTGVGIVSSEFHPANSGTLPSPVCWLQNLRPSRCGAACVTLASDLHSEGFTVVAMDPGWVATDMGTTHGGWLMEGQKPPLDAETSVAGMLKVIGGLTPAQSGAALQYTGEVLAW